MTDTCIAVATTSKAGARVVAVWHAMRRALPAEAWRILTEAVAVWRIYLMVLHREHAYYSSSKGSSRDSSSSTHRAATPSGKNQDWDDLVGCGAAGARSLAKGGCCGGGGTRRMEFRREGP